MAISCSSYVVFFALLVVTFIDKMGLCLEVDEECVFDATNERGICKISHDCPEVEELAKRGIQPSICGFYQLTVPIVCCENKNYNSPPHVVNDHVIYNPDQDTIAFPEDTPNLQQNSSPAESLRKSEQKCIEYTKPVTDVVHAIPLVTHIEPITINVEKCEYNSVALIVGGTPASAAEFPFMAALGFLSDASNIEWKCGATLISERFLLTAAHCSFSRDADAPKIIRLGELDFSRSDDSEHVDYDIQQIIVHPNYRYPQKYHDIALVQSTRTIKFTKYIRPACLYTKIDVGQNSLIATGWGKTDFAADNSDKLLKVTLRLYSNDECIRTYRTNKYIPLGIQSNMLCAGDLRGGRDTCQGDSGGPLLITQKENQCKFYVIGVTSFGKSCGQVQTPAVYTKVSEYVQWIEDQIW
ncbi:serine protease snake-like [Cylas formicarius]|uniref:serine protease snake-like n=1 Tax=Cylas formicarius TaxID=197179 RepID=UPI002958A50D|nr:serine protease snake-like [Cylas formicarius]